MMFFPSPFPLPYLPSRFLIFMQKFVMSVGCSWNVGFKNPGTILLGLEECLKDFENETSFFPFSGRVYKGICKGRIVAVKRYRTSKSFMKSEVS